MIRSLWVWANALTATFVMGMTAIVAAIVGHRGHIYDWCARSWARWIVAAAGVEVRMEGVERLHLERPQVFVSNHVSWFDVFALAAVLPKRYRFVAKKELERIPIFGTAWKAAGHISVDRSDRRAAIQSLDRAGETIRRDSSSIIIFPEGTRSWDGQLQPFKKGAFMLALHTGVEIVPVAVVGSRDVLPKGSWRVRRAPVIVRFGEAIDVRQYSTDRELLIGLTHDRIRELLEAPTSLR